MMFFNKLHFKNTRRKKMNIISNLLNSTLNYILSITGDLGIAIILLTAAVRIILMPLAFKQKLNMQKQQRLSEDLEEIKKKYKNNKEKLEVETEKYYKENAKGMLGFLTTLLQLPIIFTLYKVIIRLPMEAGTILVPWVSSLKMADSYFIVPALYIISALSPNLLSYIPFLKTAAQAKVSRANIIVTSVISGLITFKAPVAIGLYLITTSVFSVLEEIAFRLYSRRKQLV
jgi:YidC/Oxa1 family membrane protein insertase